MKTTFILSALFFLSIQQQVFSQEDSDKNKKDRNFSYDIRGEILLKEYKPLKKQIGKKSWRANRYQFSDVARTKIIVKKDTSDYQILKLLKFTSEYEKKKVDIPQIVIDKQKEKTVKLKLKFEKLLESYKDSVITLKSLIQPPSEINEKNTQAYSFLIQNINEAFKTKIKLTKKKIDSLDNTLKNIPTKKINSIVIKKGKRCKKDPSKCQTIPYKPYYVDIDDQEKLFAIKSEDFKKYIEEGYVRKSYRISWHPTLAYGASISLPFKIRPEQDDTNMKITPELSLSGYVAPRWRIHKYKDIHLNVPFSAGVSAINVNSDNLEGDEPADDALVLARTFSTGIIVEIDKFQLGLMGGWDRAGGQANKDWIYNDKFWYSFSIGFDFFNKSTNESKKAENDTN